MIRVFMMFFVFFCLVCAMSYADEKVEDYSFLTDYQKASELFDLEVKKARRREMMPTIDDPDVAPLLRFLTSAEALFLSNGDVKFKLSDVDYFCGKTHNYLMAYLNFNSDKKTSDSEVEKSVDAILEKNISTYNQSLALLHPFLLVCASAQVTLLNSYWAEISARRTLSYRAAPVIRSLGFLDSTLGITLSVLKNARATPGYQALLLDMLASVGPTIFPALTLEKRKLLKQSMLDSSVGLADSRGSKVGKIIVMLESPECQGLCQIDR